jgi:hypothetical protein
MTSARAISAQHPKNARAIISITKWRLSLLKEARRLA